MRIRYGMAVGVVVEIDEYRLERGAPCFDHFGPLSQHRLLIITAVRRSEAVQTDICEVRSQLQRPANFPPVVEAKGRIMLSQKEQNFIRKPALVAEFEHVTMASRQHGQEMRKPLYISSPVWWELK